ncbi:MAG: DUF1801 domain-containing protein [SAR202 cluster bacterium]|nr:DUF1801 domain-containing protein [SAR202 cluster bacterium]
MVKSAAATPHAYLDELSPERRTVLSALRQIILNNLPPGYTETMRWGMLCYEVPLDRCPNTYNGQPLMYAALASQKNYCSLYLTNVYTDQAAEQWFKEAFARAGKKLDMGKSCVRFKKLEDLDLEAVAQAIARTPLEKFIAGYKEGQSQRKARSRKA